MHVGIELGSSGNIESYTHYRSGKYGEKQGLVYLAIAAGCLLVGTLSRIRKIRSKVFYSKEGFVAVSLSWIIMSLVGALPFFITGDIPAYEDALFETISGFTTTGATILNKIESIPKSILFWRSFTHWIGGMGILCFLIAVVPKSNSNSMYVMKAEVPGPTAGKVTPKISESARSLYIIYSVMTVIEIIVLFFGSRITGDNLRLFDSVVTSFATAGTGGFSVLNSSIFPRESHTRVSLSFCCTSINISL